MSLITQIQEGVVRESAGCFFFSHRGTPYCAIRTSGGFAVFSGVSQLVIAEGDPLQFRLVEGAAQAEVSFLIEGLFPDAGLEFISTRILFPTGQGGYIWVDTSSRFDLNGKVTGGREVKGTHIFRQIDNYVGDYLALVGGGDYSATTNDHCRTCFSNPSVSCVTAHIAQQKYPMELYWHAYKRSSVSRACKSNPEYLFTGSSLSPEECQVFKNTLASYLEWILVA